MAASSPAADHSEDFEELAALQALHALEGDEQARFEQHAARCERCRMIVRVDRETLLNLSLAAPEMDPSPDFKARLMDRARQELEREGEGEGEGTAATNEPVQLRPSAPQADPGTDEPTDLTGITDIAGSTPGRAGETDITAAGRGRVVPFWRRQAWASALAAVLVLGIATLGGASYMNQVVASYALAGDAPGRAQVVVKRNGSIELQMEGIEAPPPGKVYEAWIIPPGQQPVPAGVVRNGGQATVPLTGQALGSTVAVTVEQGPDGTSAPTSQPVMAGAIRS